MLRAVFLFCLLGLLAAAPATARPARATWFFWLSKPEHNGSRKMPGDFTHINTTYRYHSREQHKLLSFLRFGSRRPNLARHRSSRLSHTPHKHTTGIF